jgi:hypothetical protein
VASYTAALISDTAVPIWHDAHPEMPFVFTGSGAVAAGGLGLLGTPLAQSAPARRLAVAGAVTELLATRRMEHQLGMVAEPFHEGRAGMLLKASKTLTIAGAAGAVLGRRSRLASAAAGVSLLTASACSRFGIFYAGRTSATDPKYTVVPQRRRAETRDDARAAREGSA